jgi:DNA-binding MarR family transcriptional regulator
MAVTHSIGYMLQHVASLLGKQSDQVLQEQLGIGLAQFKILQTLNVAPHTPQRDIAYALGQTEASVSRQIKLMVSDGLLHSVRSMNDHREHLTVVTAKGERLTEAGAHVLAKYFQLMLGGLNDKEQQQFMHVLEQLHKSVCAVEHGDHAGLLSTS